MRLTTTLTLAAAISVTPLTDADAVELWDVDQSTIRLAVQTLPTDISRSKVKTYNGWGGGVFTNSQAVEEEFSDAWRIAGVFSQRQQFGDMGWLGWNGNFAIVYGEMTYDGQNLLSRGRLLYDLALANQIGSIGLGQSALLSNGDTIQTDISDFGLSADLGLSLFATRFVAIDANVTLGLGNSYARTTSTYNRLANGIPVTFDFTGSSDWGWYWEYGGHLAGSIFLGPLEIGAKVGYLEQQHTFATRIDYPVPVIYPTGTVWLRVQGQQNHEISSDGVIGGVHVGYRF